MQLAYYTNWCLEKQSLRLYHELLQAEYPSSDASSGLYIASWVILLSKIKSKEILFRDTNRYNYLGKTW